MNLDIFSIDFFHFNTHRSHILFSPNTVYVMKLVMQAQEYQIDLTRNTPLYEAQYCLSVVC